MDTLSQPGSLPSKHAPTQGRRVRPRKPAPALPAQPIAPAFLRHHFLPLAGASGFIPKQTGTRRIFPVRRQFDAVIRASGPGTGELPFPLNIHTVFVQLKQQLERVQPALSLAILQTTDGVTTLATAKEVDLQGCLYSIPLPADFQIAAPEKGPANHAYSARYRGLHSAKDGYAVL